MNAAMILSVITLTASAAISVFRLVEWLRSTNPAFIASLLRKSVWLATLASVPCLVLSIIYQQWTLVAVLGVVILVTPTLNNWRWFLSGAPGHLAWPQGGPLAPVYDSAGRHPAPDSELVRRATIVLQDYLAATGHAAEGAAGAISYAGGTSPVLTKGPRDDPAPMAIEEALDVLGLAPTSTAAEIEFAHRRLMMRVHPDQGGTDYLAAKINKAKDVLLAHAAASQLRLL